MSRCIVNVATGGYKLGQKRLFESGASTDAFLGWADTAPPGSPSHYDVPYAFKAYALKAAAAKGHALLLWADASIVPIAPMAALWEKIERDGYWISRNGWTNYEWTATDAYQYLDVTPEQNRKIPHVVATSFGLNIEHEKGWAIYEEYLYLAGTRAFCGPWENAPRRNGSRKSAPCGPPDVRGHRHDQTALSVVAWRNGCDLSDPPKWFAYSGGQAEETVLVADGSLFRDKIPPL